MTNIQIAFWDFVKARELLRVRKEANQTPWTEDPILARYHFCNVNREDDTVTKWIHQHVRKKESMDLKHLIIQLTIARLINEPKALHTILPLHNLQRFADRCGLASSREGKLLRGAYMVAAHGTSEPVPIYYQKALIRLKEKLNVKWGDTRWLRIVASQMTSVVGFGDFFTNQVCTDLRYCRAGNYWYDYQTFVLAGPGTRRGVNRYLGRDIDANGQFSEELLLIRKQAPSIWMPFFLDINNLSNCFCEFDKYQRVVDQIADGETPRLKRLYKPQRA